MTQLILGVISTLTVSIVICILGIIFFKCCWLKYDWIKIPQYDEGKKKFLPEVYDQIPSGVFNMYWQLQKMLMGPINPMIERYGFDQAFYFRMRQSFICPLFISLILMTGSIFLIGWSLDVPTVDIWERVSGFNNNETLTNIFFQSMLLLCVTIPLQIQVLRVAISLEKTLQNFYEFSEEYQNPADSPDYKPAEPIRLDFWFHIRTSMIDQCHSKDFPSKHLELALMKLISESQDADIKNKGKIVETLAIPDFAHLTDLEQNIFILKSTYSEDMEQCMYCYRPCGKCCCPKFVWDYSYFHAQIDKLEDEVWEILASGQPDHADPDMTEKRKRELLKIAEETFRGSTYAFFATNTIICNDHVSKNINFHIDNEDRECWNKMCCCCAKNKTKKPTGDDEDSTGLLAIENGPNPADNQPAPTVEDTGAQKNANETTANNETLVTEPVQDQDLTKAQAQDADGTIVLVEEKPLNLEPNFKLCQNNNVVDPDDILWFNMGLKVRKTLWKT
jgi:hypothetical protein